MAKTKNKPKATPQKTIKPKEPVNKPKPPEPTPTPEPEKW